MLQLDGTIVAPTGSSHWGSGLLQWLEFTKLVGLTIKGSGTIDGNGAVWWKSVPYDNDPFDDQAKLIFPTNLTFGQKPPAPVIEFYPISLFFFLIFIFLVFFSNNLSCFDSYFNW